MNRIWSLTYELMDLVLKPLNQDINHALKVKKKLAYLITSFSLKFYKDIYKFSVLILVFYSIMHPYPISFWISLRVGYSFMFIVKEFILEATSLPPILSYEHKGETRWKWWRKWPWYHRDPNLKGDLFYGVGDQVLCWTCELIHGKWVNYGCLKNEHLK